MTGLKIRTGGKTSLITKTVIRPGITRMGGRTNKATTRTDEKASLTWTDWRTRLITKTSMKRTDGKMKIRTRTDGKIGINITGR